MKPSKPKVSVKLNKKEEKDFVCESCGYAGPGVLDEETRGLICPDCGHDLEGGDLLRLKTPASYGSEEDALSSLDVE